jgi:hypothetical protein
MFAGVLNVRRLASEQEEFEVMTGARGIAVDQP